MIALYGIRLEHSRDGITVESVTKNFVATFDNISDAIEYVSNSRLNDRPLNFPSIFKEKSLLYGYERTEISEIPHNPTL